MTLESAVEPMVRLAVDDEERVMPDTLFPVQFTPSRPPQPERALLATLLLDAVDCFLEHYGATTPHHRRLFEDAEQWIFGTDRAAPFAFEDVCDFLSLDVEHLRDALRRWRARQAPRTNTTAAILQPTNGERAA
jgi:hypothetical protein